MSNKICTATIKFNTKEVLKCINALKEFLFASDSADDLKNPDKEGYYKLLKDFEKIYEEMLDKENQGVANV
jgi:hypothetical protein